MVDFALTLAAGLCMNFAFENADPVMAHRWSVWHGVGGYVFIAAGLCHILMNRRWYAGLVSRAAVTWADMARCRLIPIYTMLFAVMAVTGPLIGLFGLTGLIGFHQGCGLIFSLFVIGHAIVRFGRL